ncbi:hypothetical protein D3C75_496890 [compost metagenome]
MTAVINFYAATQHARTAESCATVDGGFSGCCGLITVYQQYALLCVGGAIPGIVGGEI